MEQVETKTKWTSKVPLFAMDNHDSEKATLCLRENETVIVKYISKNSYLQEKLVTFETSYEDSGTLPIKQFLLCFTPEQLTLF